MTNKTSVPSTLHKPDLDFINQKYLEPGKTLFKSITEFFKNHKSSL